MYSLYYYVCRLGCFSKGVDAGDAEPEVCVNVELRISLRHRNERNLSLEQRENRYGKY